MSKGIINTVIGAAELVAGVVLIATGFGGPVGAMLIAAGTGLLFSGIGTLLSGTVSGIVTASRNPVAPWNSIYGRARDGGKIFSGEWPTQDEGRAG